MNKPLNIAMLVDTYGTNTNGTTISAKRFTEALRKRGHTVNIITGSPAEDEFTHTTGYNKLPILYQLSRSQGMFIAKSNKKILTKVIKESDIVHFLLPFSIQRKGKKISDKFNIPSTAAFHLQPENITSTLYLEKYNKLNQYIYSYFKRYYNKFNHVHCPSKMIANKLKENDYNAKLHIISNGVDCRFTPRMVEKPEKLKDKFIILMIGRLSREKRQDLIIRAVKELSFEKEVQIIFAGKGPWKNSLIEESEGLTNKPIIDFYSQKELHDIINYSDLYVHASDVEIEAISCIEAFSCGLVPIISDSVISATNQFALTKHNLFEASDAHSLCEKITYLYNQPELVKQLSKQYIEYAETYKMEKSILEIERMFYETIQEYEERYNSIEKTKLL
jgi:glycosyltransferase involved in cell wall biosynthesis